MNWARRALLGLAMIPSLALADVDPVAIRVPETKAWTGQRVSFFVDLRAKGSFDGTASFSLPAVPRSVIIKVGNPVVSSKEIEGETWFVQTHEFALFSQKSGTVNIPSFVVRFASRDGFTGPAKDQHAAVPGASIEIRRPPGSDQLGFLVTTESIDISETWNPQPGPAIVGDVFKRTIAQSADQMTGIALAPFPQAAPDGVRVYLGDPQVTDNTERGSFTGRRQDTTTYVLQAPGTHTLPAITYIWWNPKSEQLRSQTLPAVTFEVAAPPESAASVLSSGQNRAWIWWLAGALLIGGLVAWQWERIADLLGACWRTLNPPDRVASRRLLRACRGNDAAAASEAWMDWLNMQQSAFTPDEPLAAAAIDLQRHIYGPDPEDAWQGAAMARALRQPMPERHTQRNRKRTGVLPLLNPPGAVSGIAAVRRDAPA